MDAAGRWAQAMKGDLVCKVTTFGFYPIHLFIHLPSKYLLRAYHVPGTMLNVEAAHKQNLLRPYPHDTTVLVEGTDSWEGNTQVTKVIAHSEKCFAGTKEGYGKETIGDFFRNELFRGQGDT